MRGSCSSVRGNTATLFLAPTCQQRQRPDVLPPVDFLQPIYNFTFSNGLIACLVFMGIGAISDIDYLIASRR